MLSGSRAHFLSERRKATPSSLAALGSPTARFSASRRVILGRLRFEGSSLLWPSGVVVAVFTLMQRCGALAGTSSRAASVRHWQMTFPYQFLLTRRKGNNHSPAMIPNRVSVLKLT